MRDSCGSPSPRIDKLGQSCAMNAGTMLLCSLTRGAAFHVKLKKCANAQRTTKQFTAC
jgi:hypothetical protein